MDSKKYTRFLDDRDSKPVGNSIKFEKKLGPDVDEPYDMTGQSKFVLKNLRYYTVRPNMETPDQHKPTKNFCLPTMPQKKKLRPALKPVFPMKRIGDPTSKGQQWFRFSTDNDFKTQGRYSEVYALRKQKKMYPKLIFAPTYQREAKENVYKKLEGETPTSHMLWEPLTFSKLLEDKPTRSVPGESVFRHGRAQQWVIKNAAVIK